jgi:hypothetical protein
MSRWKGHLGSALLAPLMSAGLLLGIFAENGTHLKPADVEPYHARAKEAVLGHVDENGNQIGGVPTRIDSWYGRDEEIPQAAQSLLKPNAILSRSYRDTSLYGEQTRLTASLLIVQCRDTRDMRGHYPPICYRAHGHELVEQKRKDWIVGDNFKIEGMSYEFAKLEASEVRRIVVYNFIILPGPNGAIVPDIQGVNRISEDYQQRYYGAAQFQLVMSAAIPESDRDAIFQQLVGGKYVVSVIETLRKSSVNP